MEWLRQDPSLRRDDEKHVYWLGDHPFPVSVTGILSAGKSSGAIASLEKTRHEWGPRGTNTHRALELFLKKSFHPDSLERDVASLQEAQEAASFEPYREFIDPLLAHPLWGAVEPFASEVMLCNRALNFAGTFDGAYYCKDTEGNVSSRTLFDLKTQRKKRPYSVAAQLGAYLSMAESQGIEFDNCVAIWARPGETSITSHSVTECKQAWTHAWLKYLSIVEPF